MAAGQAARTGTGVTANPDLSTLVSGVAIAALGLVLLLDSTGAIQLTAGWIGALVCAGVGTLLCASALGGDAVGVDDDAPIGDADGSGGDLNSDAARGPDGD